MKTDESTVVSGRIITSNIISNINFICQSSLWARQTLQESERRIKEMHAAEWEKKGRLNLRL